MPAAELLDEMQWVADPLADGVVAEILQATPPHERRDRIRQLNELVSRWRSNEHVFGWEPGPGDHPALEAPVKRYLAAALDPPLPPWAERERLRRAESLFMDYGPLSVTLLFCSSLPECYVIPDLAEVLQTTGQLSTRTDHRIRSTGAMIFPVMMVGGLTHRKGAGIAQILKVRLIHAMVRNLILRDLPERVAARARGAETEELRAGLVPRHDPPPGERTRDSSLAERGWNFTQRRMPNNQEELAYTLLTFSYVFLRGMEDLHVPLTAQQQEDYIHAWNVAGHFLGIRRELMVDTMPQARALFTLMQERGRRDAGSRDVSARGQLAWALVDTMQRAMPLPLKFMPLLLTRELLGPQTTRDLTLGLTRVSGFFQWLFHRCVDSAERADRLGRRLFGPTFSICRLATRVLGYRFVCRMLMDETRELAIPAELRPRVLKRVRRWGRDRLAGRGMNLVEDALCTRFGAWEPLRMPQRRAP